MKNLILAMALMAGIVISGCSEDDDQLPLTVDTSPIEMLAGDSILVEAKSSHNITFDLNNKYVGNIDSLGWFKPVRIGEGDIMVSSNGETRSIPFEVNPKYNTYTEPKINWDLQEDDFRQNNDDFNYMGDGMYYKPYGSGKSILAYSFEKGIVDSFILYFKAEYFESVSGFIMERYYPAGYTEEIFVFRDNLVSDLAETYVSLSTDIFFLDNELVFSVLYSPANALKNAQSYQEQIKLLKREESLFKK